MRYETNMEDKGLEADLNQEVEPIVGKTPVQDASKEAKPTDKAPASKPAGKEADSENKGSLEQTMSDKMMDAIRLTALAITKLFDTLLGTNMAANKALNTPYGKVIPIRQPKALNNGKPLSKDKLADFANQVSKQHGVALPLPAESMSKAEAIAFINKNAPDHYVTKDGLVCRNGDATDKQIKFAESISEKHGLEMPEGRDFKSIRMFLNDHANLIKEGDPRYANKQVEATQDVTVSKGNDQEPEKENERANSSHGEIGLKDILRGDATEADMLKQQEKLGKEGHSVFKDAVQDMEKQQSKNR